jgi:hypothetical protein
MSYLYIKPAKNFGMVLHISHAINLGELGRNLSLSSLLTGKRQARSQAVVKLSVQT